MTKTDTLFAVLMLDVTGTSWAQSSDDEQPAVLTSGAGEQSPVQTAPEPVAAPAAAVPTPKTGMVKGNEGTTIVGDRESPIGLYITPWHNATPEADIDRPARLLSVGLEPLDRRVFARQVEYYEALTAAQAAKSGDAAPASSAKP